MAVLHTAMGRKFYWGGKFYCIKTLSYLFPANTLRTGRSDIKPTRA